jgi:hypothetical protein
MRGAISMSMIQQQLPRQSEADTKRAIVQYLKTRGHLVIPYRTAGVKTATKGWIPAPRTGISDLLGLTKEGKFFAIEVKGAAGKTSPDQDRFLESVRSCGCIAIVARSIQDVQEAGL